MTTDSSDKLLIGAHTSAAGGVHNALLEGKAIGATTIQLFTANQKRWEGKLLSQEAIDLWHKTVEETGMSSIMSHDSYLINLGSPNPESLEKSRTAFQNEIKRCLALNLTFLNFHPGASVGSSKEQCMDLICESLIECEALVAGTQLRLLLESTAGQGTAIGHRFEELAYILHRVKDRVPVGICIDTCHAFAAGYDIRTPAAFDKTLKDFDNTVGLQHLYAFHVNDSAKELGTRVDRHKTLGDGFIGMESFQFLMTDPRTKKLPKYIETPEGPAVWKKEIEMLRELAKEGSSAHKN